MGESFNGEGQSIFMVKHILKNQRKKFLKVVRVRQQEIKIVWQIWFGEKKRLTT
jgi:hypothetical protein